MFKKGFTLAEVLITLLIIGVVAALTIPSVISNYQQQEFKTGLKKAVSVLNEAIQTNIAQDGETPYENEDLFLYLQKHMSVIKSLGANDTIEIKDDNDNTIGIALKNRAFYTNDGMRFEVTGTGTDSMKLHETGLTLAKKNWPRYAKCGSYGITSEIKGSSGWQSELPCYVLVDVNGDRKPTVYGANSVRIENSGILKNNYQYPNTSDKKLTDIFPIMITVDRAVPFGVVAQRAMYSK